MASARQEITISATPMKIWLMLGDVTKWPSWNPKVAGAKMLQGDEFYPGSTFEYKLEGKPLVGTITLIDRPKALAWRAGNSRYSVKLEAAGPQATRVVGETEISGGLLSSLRKAKAEAEARDACQQWLSALKQAVEKA
jgi:hypothetical protein